MRINHVALEVGDVETAVEFWRAISPELGLAAREPGKAFLDLGDQYVALLEGRTQERDARRHFGLVVDDVEAAAARARNAGAEMRRDRFFLDPWATTSSSSPTPTACRHRDDTSAASSPSSTKNRRAF